MHIVFFVHLHLVLTIFRVCFYRVTRWKTSYTANVSKQDSLILSIHATVLIISDSGVSLIESLRGNCTPAAVEQFPRPMFSIEQRRHGWLLAHIIVAVFMFASLSTLCEDYFVPAIEVSLAKCAATVSKVDTYSFWWTFDLLYTTSLWSKLVVVFGGLSHKLAF